MDFEASKSVCLIRSPPSVFETQEAPTLQSCMLLSCMFDIDLLLRQSSPVLWTMVAVMEAVEASKQK